MVGNSKYLTAFGCQITSDILKEIFLIIIKFNYLYNEKIDEPKTYINIVFFK